MLRNSYQGWYVVLTYILVRGREVERVFLGHGWPRANTEWEGDSSDWNALKRDGQIGRTARPHSICKLRAKYFPPTTT